MLPSPIVLSAAMRSNLNRLDLLQALLARIHTPAKQSASSSKRRIASNVFSGEDRKTLFKKWNRPCKF